MKTYRMTITIPDVSEKRRNLWQKLTRKPVEYIPVTISLFAPLKKSEINNMIDGKFTFDVLMKFGIKIERMVQTGHVFNYVESKDDKT